MDLRAWLESGKRPAATAVASPSPSKQAKTDAPEEEVLFSKEKAKELLAVDEFSDQPLEVRQNEVYCLACKAKVQCKAKLLRQHCFQKQTMSARV
jgi:hypothetical protein